jgi:hypothetical protein
MARFFNTTGFCNPERHYMVEPFRGMYDHIYRLIEAEQFFVIHAPRQTGKTTFLHALAHRLNREGKYIGMVFSVETAGVPSFTQEEANENMTNALYRMAPLFLPESERPAPPQHPISLKNYLNNWSLAQTKSIVLLIDEADSLWDDVLVSFLRQLRDGFQLRPKGFPQSVALVGLRDIREYRMKPRGDNPSLGSGSPFNVKARSFFLPVFTKEEVADLLGQHTQQTGQVFEPEVMDRLYAYSGGQPWLTNALANGIVAEMLENDYSKPITLNMVEAAKENLIAQRQTHLDSLVDKLREDRVRRVVMSVITGASPQFDNFDDAILYCRDLGIIAPNAPVRFANPIYREIITRIVNASFHYGFNQDIVETQWYLHPDGRMDMDKLLRAFVDFYRRHSESWLERFEFKEAGHQLLLMAFLQRIVNGGGRIEREMAAGNGRTDLVVFWNDQVIPIELKIKYDKWTREDGLRQIGRYMDKLGQQHGYLVLFEPKSSEQIPWEERLSWTEETLADGRQITILEM